MKSYSQLTLLSSSLLLASFGLQAAVVQMTESVSSVAYQGQQAITAVLPVAIKSVPDTKPVAETSAIIIVPVEKGANKPSASMPELLIVELVEKPETKVKPVPIMLPLPLKITPAVHATIDVPTVPTVISVQPVLNISALVTPASNAIDEEPSLFSAISDWFSVKPVKPWQKGTLAKKAMKPGGEVPEFDVFSEKVFAYKQGSIGGNGGGGCGCN